MTSLKEDSLIAREDLSALLDSVVCCERALTEYEKEEKHEKLLAVSKKLKELQILIQWFKQSFPATSRLPFSEPMVAQTKDKFDAQVRQLEANMCKHQYEFRGQDGEGAMYCKYCGEHNRHIMF